jgi:peptidoglycan/LPS O-acetylase OafA/YrhL
VSESSTVTLAAPGAAAAPGRRHFSCFDGLRALAALAIVGDHLGFQTAKSFTSPAGPYLARLDSGVSVFFLISGFLLYRPFVVANLGGRPVIPTAAFYLRRLARIFPAYWLALTGVIVFFGLRLHSWLDAVVYYGLLQIYDHHRYLHGISQAWSLATEVSFYAFLPLYAWGVRRLSRGRDSRGRVGVEIGTAVVLGVAGLLFRSFADFSHPVWPIADTHTTWQIIGVYWLPAYFDLFAVGIVLAVISAAMEAGTLQLPVAEVIGRHPGLCWAGAGVAFWVVATRVGLPRGLEPISAKEELAKHLLYGLVGLFLLLPAVFGPDRRGLIRRGLASRPLVALGVVSYGVYLWHQAILEQARRWTGADMNQLSGNPWTVGFITVTVSVAIASLSWFMVERPVLHLAHRRTARSPAVPPAAARTAP